MTRVTLDTGKKYWHVHAKVAMTKGHKGASIELEGYMYVEAPDIETAKDRLRQEINSRFTSGDIPFCDAVKKIEFFANEVTKAEYEETGIIKWRDEFLKARSRWQQEEITNYL